MDYAELFDRQGALVDDLLMHAFRVPQEQFVAPGPADGPSLRDLLVAWLEEQRRAVHASLQDRPYAPLPPAATANVPDLARSFGGFRMTLRDALEGVFETDLTRKVPWTSAGGATREVTVDELLAHLVLHGARMTSLVAERLRQLGAAPPPLDLLG